MAVLDQRVGLTYPRPARTAGHRTHDAAGHDPNPPGRKPTMNTTHSPEPTISAHDRLVARDRLVAFVDNNAASILNALSMAEEHMKEVASTASYPASGWWTDTAEKYGNLAATLLALVESLPEQRAAAKTARDAKKIASALTADGSEFVITCMGRRERFQTERAASMWYVDTLCWGFQVEQKRESLEQIVQAIASKHGTTPEQVREDLNKKVAAKTKREAR